MTNRRSRFMDLMPGTGRMLRRKKWRNVEAPILEEYPQGTLRTPDGRPIIAVALYSGAVEDGRPLLEIAQGAPTDSVPRLAVSLYPTGQRVTADGRPIYAVQIGPLSGGAVAPVVYALDLISATPSFAASTRKLRAAYAGPALRVRRASDSVESDISFAADGTVDAAALDAFAAGSVLYVKTWYDQSGNARHATAAAADQPIIDTRSMRGARGITFGRTSAGLTIPAHSMSNLNTAWFFVGGAAHVSPTYMMLYEPGGDFMGRYGSNSFHALNDKGPSQVPPKNLRNVSGFEFVGTNIGQTGLSNQKFMAGDDVTDEAAFTATMTGPYSIGGSPSFNIPLAGVGAAAILFDAALSGVNLAAFRTAMEATFGITRARTKTVGFLGDSIMAGTAASQGQTPSQAAALRTDWPRNVTLIGAGISSTTTTDFPSMYSDLKSIYSPLDFIVHQHGTNDLGVLGETNAATIHSRIVSNCGLVRADSKKVIVCTILPANHGNAATRDALNALIRANWASYADVMLDLAADPTIGAAGAQNNTALYPDALHPSPLNLAYQGALYAAAVSTLA